MDTRTDPGSLVAPSVDVALLCPLAVGVVAWSAPEPTMTVVVKATFTLPEDGAARLAEVQEPLALDEQGGPGEPGDLDRASDFAPLKARADVILVGHAYATSPMHVLSAGFAVDKLRKRFYAVAAAPSAQTPLYPQYLRATPGPEGAPVQVGARAIWAGRAIGSELVSRDGVPIGPFPRGFDYGLFNVAPPDQQLGLLSPTSRLVLEGLVPGGDRRMVRLPGARPRVFSLPPEGAGGARAADETPLRCDTLWIDAGNERCTLTFRGVLSPAAGGAWPTLVVALDFGSERQSWSAIRAELDRARWTRAATPESTRRGGIAPPVARAAPSMPRRTLTLDLSQMPSSSRAAQAITGGRTQELDTRLVEAAIPFGAREEAPATPRALMVLGGGRTTLASFHPPPIENEETVAPDTVTAAGFALPDDAPPRAATLPFTRGAATRTLPFSTPATGAPALPFSPSQPGTGLPFAPATAPAAAMPAPFAHPAPFVQPAPFAQPAPSLPFPRFASPEETRLAPVAEPAPRDVPTSLAVNDRPVTDLLPLDTYAAIKAATWGGGALGEALRAKGIDEIRWYSNERRLAAALAAEATEGTSALSKRLRRALKAAKGATAKGADDRLPPPEEPRRRVKLERAPRGATRVAVRPSA